MIVSIHRLVGRTHVKLPICWLGEAIDEFPSKSLFCTFPMSILDEPGAHSFG